MRNKKLADSTLLLVRDVIRHPLSSSPPPPQFPPPSLPLPFFGPSPHSSAPHTVTTKRAAGDEASFNYSLTASVPRDVVRMSGQSQQWPASRHLTSDGAGVIPLVLHFRVFRFQYDLRVFSTTFEVFLFQYDFGVFRLISGFSGFSTISVFSAISGFPV